MAAATFSIVSGPRLEEAGKPVSSCFVYVPPSDSAKLQKYPQMRRWLDANRGQKVSTQHRFTLENGAISPAATVFHVGDSVDRFLNSESTLSLEMFSNPPIGPAPTIIRNYTFKKTESLPIRISAASQAAASAHALVLDHDFGAASGKDGRVVISGLPTGIDIPMRISLPTTADPINFQSDSLDIERDGCFVLRLNGEMKFQVAITQGQDVPKSSQVESNVLPPCVRVSGEVRDASEFLLRPASLSIGLGPCSEACEITVEDAIELLRKHPTAKELVLWGWPVATTECQELMRGLAGIPHVSRLSLMGLEVDKTILSLAASNPQLRELSLGGRCRFSERGEEDSAWVFDAIAQSGNLERIEISRHTRLHCQEISRLEPMLRLKHFAFDGPVNKPCMEGIARLRRLVSLELPEYDPSVHGVEYLSGIENLQHLTCAWSDASKPSALHELSELQFLTIIGDPRFVNWEAIKSLPKVQAVHIRSREPGTIENALGMKFIPIPMALPGKPAERIYMQQAEVTYEQYRRFKVAAGLANTQAEKNPSDAPLYPQDFDHWDDVARFIAQLNRWDTKYTYRMPTEDEWEFACTGRVGGPPVSRNVCQDPGNTNRWTRQSEPNQFGLYDMLGVYGEYCSDLYNRNDDPSLRVIAEGKDARVVRGMRQLADQPGCFRYSSDYRFPVSAGGQTPRLVIGVRLVLEPKK